MVVVLCMDIVVMWMEEYWLVLKKTPWIEVRHFLYSFKHFPAISVYLSDILGLHIPIMTSQKEPQHWALTNTSTPALPECGATLRCLILQLTTCPSSACKWIPLLDCPVNWLILGYVGDSEIILVIEIFKLGDVADTLAYVLNYINLRSTYDFLSIS